MRNVIQLLQVHDDGTVGMVQWTTCAHKLEALTGICKDAIGEPQEFLGTHDEDGAITSVVSIP